MSKKRPPREKLKELYHVDGLTQQQIANKYDVAQQTVCSWMRRYEIEARPKYHNLQERVSYAGFNPADHNGYERWRSWNSETGENDRVYVHRLAAVAWFGFDAVAGREVHHRSEVPWDNREENFETFSKGEHRAHHNAQRGTASRSG